MIFTTAGIAKLADVPLELMPQILKIIAADCPKFYNIKELIARNESDFIATAELYDLIDYCKQHHAEMFTVSEQEAVEKTGRSRQALGRLRLGETQNRRRDSGEVYTHTTEPKLRDRLDWMLRDGVVMYRREALKKVAKK